MINDPYAAQSRRQRTGLIVGSVLAVAVLVLGSRQLGLSQGTQAPDFGGAMQARSAAPPPITAESSGTPPPLLTEAAEPPPEAARMPADIREWLEHLERIERQRQALATQQVSAAMVSLTMLQGAGATQQILDGLLDTGEEDTTTTPETPNPAAELQRDNQDFQAEWEKLMADFRALPPPPACVPLRNSYDQTLGQTEMMINEIVGAMDKASSDPQAALRDLFGMRGTSGGRIDAAAAQSNRNLEEVCRPYGVRPWFQIQTDSQAGILGKMGGLPDIGGLGGGLGGF